MKTRLCPDVKRGALVKAVSIGVKNKVVLEPLTRILESIIDYIYQTH
jgi:hypothetical protein